MVSNEELERRAEITIGTCEGIQPMHVIFYVISIRYSAKRALEAFELYDYLLGKNADASSLVSAVQEAIGHIGALSLYFWPSLSGKKKDKINQYELKMARGKKLREKFNITEESPLSDRGLRNAWQHFDEKLDTYVLSHDAGHFFPTPIVQSHTLADDPVEKIFKLLDPEAECLVLLGKKYFFGPLRTEAEKIFSVDEQENS